MPPPAWTKRFWSKVTKTPHCWIWTGSTNDDGYGQLRVDGRLFRVHRLSFELHNGPVDGDLFVLHSCDNPPCVKPDHLFLGDQTANMRDAATKGRIRLPSNLGEQNPSAKLTKVDVGEIRRLGNAGLSHRKLGEMFGCSHAAIGYVLRGKNWGHV